MEWCQSITKTIRLTLKNKTMIMVSHLGIKYQGQFWGIMHQRPLSISGIVYRLMMIKISISLMFCKTLEQSKKKKFWYSRVTKLRLATII